MKEKTKEIITKRKEQSKGITLIALVITIIVLLILAGVTIATLTGDNGLLSKASTAKNTSTEAEILEKLKLAYQDYYLGQHTETGYTFQNALDKMFGTGVATATGPNSNGVYTVSVNRKIYEVNSTTGTAGEKKPILADVTKDNYGDYIDLGQSVEGVGASTSADDWRILYNDKNGHVYAILADYLQNNNPAVIASRLLTIENYNVYSDISRQDLFDKLNSTTAWQSLIPAELRDLCQVKGAMTGEMLIASYNERHSTNLNLYDYPNLFSNPSNSEGIDDLYVPHSRAGENCLGYLLASPSNEGNAFLFDVFCDGFVGGCAYLECNYGVCPIVSLPSDLQVTKNGTVWTVVLPQ